MASSTAKETVTIKALVSAQYEIESPAGDWEQADHFELVDEAVSNALAGGSGELLDFSLEDYEQT
jgi:hypothetical protein